MSDPTRPWGPHGPQVPQHTVTPNPTAPSAPYIPGSSQAPPDHYAGGGPALDGDWRPSGRAQPKSVMMGLVLTFFFGPLGLLYAVWGTGQAVPAILWGGVTTLMLVWNPNLGLTPFWLISMIWSTLTILGYNRRFGSRASGS